MKSKKKSKICLEEFFRMYDLNLESWVNLFSKEESYKKKLIGKRLHRRIFKDITHNYGIELEDIFGWPIDEVSTATKFYQKCGFKFDIDPTSCIAYVDMGAETTSMQSLHNLYEKLWVDYVTSKGHHSNKEANKRNFSIFLSGNKSAAKPKSIRKEVQRLEGIYKKFNKKTREESGV